MSEVKLCRRFRLGVSLGTALIGLATACAEPSGPDVSIVIVPSVDTLVLGSSTTFRAQVMGGMVADGASIRWLTSDSTVTMVGSDGRAHGLTPGVATITASVAGVISAPATLVVVGPDPAMGLSPARVSVRVGSVVLFTASVAAAQASGVPYKWTTSDPRIAAIFHVPTFPYALGVALQPGIAEIRVSAGGVASAPSIFEVVGTAAHVQAAAARDPLPAKHMSWSR